MCKTNQRKWLDRFWKSLALIWNRVEVRRTSQLWEVNRNIIGIGPQSRTCRLRVRPSSSLMSLLRFPKGRKSGKGHWRSNKVRSFINKFLIFYLLKVVKPFNLYCTGFVEDSSSSGDSDTDTLLAEADEFIGRVRARGQFRASSGLVTLADWKDIRSKTKIVNKTNKTNRVINQSPSKNMLAKTH